MKDKDFANTTVLYFNGFKWNKSQWIENFLKACFRTYLKIAQNKDILLLNYFFACEKEQTEIVTKIIFAVLLIVSGIKIGPFFFVQTKWKTKEPQMSYSKRLYFYTTIQIQRLLPTTYYWSIISSNSFLRKQPAMEDQLCVLLLSLNWKKGPNVFPAKLRTKRYFQIRN